MKIESIVFCFVSSRPIVSLFQDLSQNKTIKDVYENLNSAVELPFENDS